MKASSCTSRQRRVSRNRSGATCTKRARMAANGSYAGSSCIRICCFTTRMSTRRVLPASPSSKDATVKDWSPRRPAKERTPIRCVVSFRLRIPQHLVYHCHNVLWTTARRCFLEVERIFRQVISLFSTRKTSLLLRLRILREWLDYPSATASTNRYSDVGFVSKICPVVCENGALNLDLSGLREIQI